MVRSLPVARRALILTGSLGAGHDAAASQVTGALSRLGWHTRTVDAMALLGGRSGAAGEVVFRRLIAAGGLYDALHYAHLRTGSRLALAMDRLAVSRAVPALRRTLQPEETLVVSTFPTGASAAARVAATRPGVTTVVMCTDPVVHRLWVHPGTDLFIVTSQAAAASVRRYQPRARIAVVAMPLREAFREPPQRMAARRQLGIPDDARCAMILGGGWGIGPIRDLSERLADRGVHVLAVAGRNVALQRRLEDLAARNPAVHAYGFTEAIATLMAAADVVATAPGAASCAEVRAVGRPLVLMDVLPGHGRESIDHELERGAAAVAGADPAQAAEVVLGVLDEPQLPAPAAACGEWDGQLQAALASVAAGPAG